MCLCGWVVGWCVSERVCLFVCVCMRERETLRSLRSLAVFHPLKGRGTLCFKSSTRSPICPSLDINSSAHSRVSLIASSFLMSPISVLINPPDIHSLHTHLALTPLLSNSSIRCILSHYHSTIANHSLTDPILTPVTGK